MFTHYMHGSFYICRVAQDGLTKKKKKREVDEDSEYSEDDRGMFPLHLSDFLASCNIVTYSSQPNIILFISVTTLAVPPPKVKRSDDFATVKAGRSTSPQPVKPTTNRNNTPKANQVHILISLQITQEFAPQCVL